MLQVMQDLPQGVLGIRATGRVSGDDYLKVAFPTFAEYAKNTQDFRYLLLMETTVGNFAIEAMLNDAILGYQYLTKWKKVAIVTDQTGVIAFTHFVGNLAPGQYKGFKHSELDKAKEWLSN